MENFRGTRGKWEFSNEKFIEIQIKKPLKSICAINTNLKEYESNAQLIAHAPEMLEMLEKLIVTFSGEDLELYQVTRLKEAERLIKKATTI
jgi:hypothetical protein